MPLALLGLVTVAVLVSCSESGGEIERRTEPHVEEASSTTAESVPATTAPPPSEPPPTSASTTSTAAPVSTAAPSAASAPPPAASSGEAPLAGRIVVIDPGHNGANASHPREINAAVDAGGFTKACNTTGTSAGDYTESRFNWELAQRVVARLEALGARVVLTRSDDSGWGPCIDQRGLTAAGVGADLLLSLHADGSAAGNHGFHVIHPDVVPGYTDSTAASSGELATAVRDSLVLAGFSPSNYAGRDGLVSRGDLGTLNRATVAAVMVEAGNMADPGDLAVLRSASGQDRLADALAAGVVDYLRTGG